MSWEDFFKDTLERTPLRNRHEKMLSNVHPNEKGEWVWHVSLLEGADPAAQVARLEEILECVGEGDCYSYAGGVVKKLVHVTKRLSAEEVKDIPENAQNMVEAFADQVTRRQKGEKWTGNN